MSDDYLWDGSGHDEEVERIEHVLQPLALKAQDPLHVTVRSSGGKLMIAALAAALLVAAISSVIRINAPEKPRTIEFDGLGSFTVQPDARVQVVRRGDDLIKLRLERGTIEARISLAARPRLFQVETPATTCVDLGCHYTLSVDAAGRSVVSVQTGRVAFIDRGREVFVPRDASCRATPARGAGTPVYDDAPQAFIDAVRAFDEATDVRRMAEAGRVAAAARERDAVSLWNMLQDADDGVVRIAYDGLVRLVGLPEGVTREATLHREVAALQAWKARLGW